MNPTLLDFYEFIYDRQEIWHKKNFLKKPDPWTKDPILRKYKFCNVYRELDKCSVHLIKKVINANMSLEDKIFNVLIYRRFNTSRFFYLYGTSSSNPKISLLKGFEKKMDEEKKKGTRLFSDAYIICQRTFASDYRKGDKHVQQILLLQEYKKRLPNLLRIIKRKKLSEIHKELTKIPLTGDFLAYQYLTDITYLPEFKDKWNIDSFVVMGPGSIPGVQILFPKIEKKDCAEKCVALFRSQKINFNKLKLKTGKDWLRIRYKTPYYDSPYLSLSDIQNCLCEFRKYWLLKNNLSGVKKRHYKLKETNYE